MKKRGDQEILKRFEELLHLCQKEDPDIRIMQHIGNALGTHSGTDGYDGYFVEDENLVERLGFYLDNLKKRGGSNERDKS